jgi:hypothetical protein
MRITVFSKYLIHTLANSLAASAALLANYLPDSKKLNIDLKDVFAVNDSLGLANLVLDDHLSVFSVSVIDDLRSQTLCLLQVGYVARFQRSLYNKFLDLEIIYQTYPWTNIFQ